MSRIWKKVSSLQGFDWLFLVSFFIVLIQGLYFYSRCDSRRVLLIASIFLLFLLLFYGLHMLERTREKYRIDRMFLAVLMFLGLVYMVVFPPGAVPDELYHFEASYKLSDYLCLTIPSQGSLPMRADDAAFIQNVSLFSDGFSSARHDALASAFSFFSTDSSMVTVSPVSSFDLGQNPLQLKLPSALGIAFARLLNLGCLPLFYFGRLFNFIYFAALVYFAVKIIPFAKKTMMAVALLPMTLHISSSYSYDAGIIGLSFLFSALCFRAICSEDEFKLSNRVALATAAVLLAPCKVVYVFLVFLVIFIPSRKFLTTKGALLFKVCILAAAFASIIVLRIGFLFELSGIDTVGAEGSELDNRGSETGRFYGLSDILANPLGVLLIFLRTFDYRSDFYFNTVVGGSLGWFQEDIIAPSLLVCLLWVLLIVSSLRSKEDASIVPVRYRFACGLIAVVGWICIMLSMLIGWTFVTESIIEGVQGRYLLPLLPIAFLAIRSRSVYLDCRVDNVLLLSLVAVNVCYLTRIVAVTI